MAATSSRRREPEVGMWLRIQERHDKGGAPLVRVERIDSRGWVYVTDWLDFDREAPREQMPGGYTPPRERCFAFDADEFSKRSLRYWKRAKPTAPPSGQPAAHQPAKEPHSGQKD